MDSPPARASPADRCCKASRSAASPLGSLRLNAEHISEVYPNDGSYVGKARTIIVMANGYRRGVYETGRDLALPAREFAIRLLQLTIMIDADWTTSNGARRCTCVI